MLYYNDLRKWSGKKYFWFRKYPYIQRRATRNKLLEAASVNRETTHIARSLPPEIEYAQWTYEGWNEIVAIL